MKKKFNKEDLLSRAKLLANDQRFLEAIVLFRDLVVQYPDDSEIKFLLGVAQLKAEQFESAIKTLRRSIKQDPSFPLVNHALGSALFMTEEFEASIYAFDREIEINPSYADAYCDKAYALNELKRYQEALLMASKARQLDPLYADTYNVIALSLNGVGQYDEAMEYALKAISIDRTKANYFDIVGTIHLNLGALNEALDYYKIALEINPSYEQAGFNKSLIHLRLLDFEKGWRLYEHRFATYPKASRNKVTTRDFNLKEFKSLGRIFIFYEQGIGDQVLFASIFHEIDKKENDIYIEINEKLMPIFKRSFKNLKFVTSKNYPDSKMYDSTFGIASLPSFFRRSIDSFKIDRNFFLLTDKSKTRGFRQKILSTKPLNKICGISWRSANETIGMQKSVELESLRHILIIPKITFVNLQYNPPLEELELFEAEHKVRIKNFSEVDLFNDVDSLCSLVDACDFVVTISNINAHVAGALGKKTFLLVPFSKGRHWYWHEKTSRSLWYPSVEIFSQTQSGNWTKSINKIKEKIVEEIAHE